MDREKLTPHQYASIWHEAVVSLLDTLAPGLYNAEYSLDPTMSKTIFSKTVSASCLFPNASDAALPTTLRFAARTEILKFLEDQGFEVMHPNSSGATRARISFGMTRDGESQTAFLQIYFSMTPQDAQNPSVATIRLHVRLGADALLREENESEYPPKRLTPKERSLTYFASKCYPLPSVSVDVVHRADFFDHVVAGHGVTADEVGEALENLICFPRLERRGQHGAGRCRFLGLTSNARVLEVVADVKPGQFEIVTAFDVIENTGRLEDWCTKAELGNIISRNPALERIVRNIRPS